MVFCGRPSKACQRCRSRRLKCDLKPGSCSCCIRAQAACNGYRDTQQIRFRDETSRVQKTINQRTCQRITYVSPQSVDQPIELRARESFFAHHVVGGSKTWYFLSPYYDQANSPTYLAASLEAVGLAYLYHETGSISILESARQKYGTALAMTRRALQFSDTSSNDTTLLTSLLLDLYEKITNTIPRHIQSWVSHIAGAMALVQLRGLDNLKDPATLQVLVRLSTNLLISFVASDSPVPNELVVLRTHAQKYLNIEDPKWQLSGLMVNYANLRSILKQNNMPTSQQIDLLDILDREFEKGALAIPDAWRYVSKFRTALNIEDIFQGRVDFYPDRHATQTWNVLRLVRILLNEFILQLCSNGTSTLEPHFSTTAAKAKQNIQYLAEEICASVPQYDIFFDKTFSGKPKTHSPLVTGGSCQMLTCYSLIFPLYVAGRSAGSSVDLKYWVVRKLRSMAQKFSIRNAHVVADILQTGSIENPWAVYAMLGSYAFSA